MGETKGEERDEEIAKLRAERDELAAALRRARAHISGQPPRDRSLLEQIGAALAKVPA